MRIGLKNGGEMEGEVVHGVLHGKVLIRGKANTLIFSGKCMMLNIVRMTMTIVVFTISISGRYMDGYPEGPAWIF